MAHYATHRFNYWSQLAILAGLCGAGLLIGTIAMMIPFMGQVDFFNMKGGSDDLMQQLISLPNATSLLRWAQAIATPFIFLLPALLYARICHIHPMRHYGFNQSVNIRQLLVVILIMMAASPAVAALQEFTEMLPWSKAALARFHQAEEAYNQQVAVMARMDGMGDFLVSLFIIALLPAVFEELMFRGCWQNLFQPLVQTSAAGAGGCIHPVECRAWFLPGFSESFRAGLHPRLDVLPYRQYLAQHCPRISLTMPLL